MELLDVAHAQRRALAILIPALDIIEGRVDDGAPPAWCEARGWTDFLLALDDHDLARCEAGGLAAHLACTTGAPPSLLALAREVTAATHLPALRASASASLLPRIRSVGARKQRQLEPLLAAVGPMAKRAHRIVDVGAGRGHFTRIASALFDRDALGLDREPTRVAAAEALAGGGGARFNTFDACLEELTFAPTDLAVGLHACGEVGDRIIAAAARSGCDLALISCCLQKIGGSVRTPLSRAACAAGMFLSREALGLSNQSARPEGVEGSLRDTMAAREHRHALLHLLRSRGITIRPGEEMRGQNRRRAHDGLRAIASRALELRGLPKATDSELLARAEEARWAFARVRRLSLPRSMLARLAEVAVVLDRAAALADAGLAVEIATLFTPDVTPRNLALFASSAEERLPATAKDPPG